ncbi:hypothetical protein DSECCO2_524620 [anaerobic digester metagenome]
MAEVEFNIGLIVGQFVTPLKGVGQCFIIGIHVAARFQIGQKFAVIFVGDLCFGNPESLNQNGVLTDNGCSHRDKSKSIRRFYRLVFSRTK